MNGYAALAILSSAAIWSMGCGPSDETARLSSPPPAEELYRAGHQYFLERNLDSAAALLDRSVATDSSFAPALSDLADAQYARGMAITETGNPGRLALFRAAREALSRLETLGTVEGSVYDRLCELSVSLDDSRAFLRYARKNVEKFPYDRQYYNYGVALYQTGDYDGVVKAMKEAIEKFRFSSYLGGYYREQGLAYMKIDRDQTATRTFESGVTAVEKILAGLKKDESTSGDVRRLSDDRTGMLLSLRKLYATYKQGDNLERVERILRHAGSLK